MKRRMYDVDAATGYLIHEHDETKGCLEAGCVSKREREAEAAAAVLAVDAAVFFTGRVGDDHGRRYIITDDVLYEDEFPTLFRFIVGSESEN